MERTKQKISKEKRNITKAILFVFGYAFLTYLIHPYAVISALVPLFFTIIYLKQTYSRLNHLRDRLNSEGF